MTTEASRTAVLVCQGRAAAQERIAVGRFSDPVAGELLRDVELVVVEQVRRQQPPKGWGPRMAYELANGCAWLMAPRTVAIDDAVREHRASQLVILGAGLDARAWRMEELAATTVYEVDHPASQRDKQERLAGRPAVAGAVSFVPADLAVDDLGAALGAAGHHTGVPTTWVWEGVVPYLTAEQVTATVEALVALSAVGSRLVVNYQSPSRRMTFGKLVGRAMTRLSGGQDPWSAEPWRSRWTPERMAGLLREHGFGSATDRDLLTISRDLGMEIPAGALGGSLGSGHVMVADRT